MYHTDRANGNFYLLRTFMAKVREIKFKRKKQEWRVDNDTSLCSLKKVET